MMSQHPLYSLNQIRSSSVEVLPANASQGRGLQQSSVAEQFQEGVLPVPLEGHIRVHHRPELIQLGFGMIVESGNLLDDAVGLC